jgi:hypothetical protein
MRTELWSKNLKGKDLLEDLIVDGRNILNGSKRNGYEDMDWIHVIQDRTQLPAVVSKVMNTGFLNFLTD